MANEEMTWESACKKLCKRLGLKLVKVSGTKYAEIIYPDSYGKNWDETVCSSSTHFVQYEVKTHDDVFKKLCWCLGTKSYLKLFCAEARCVKKLATMYTNFGCPDSIEEMMLKLEVADGISL